MGEQFPKLDAKLREFIGQQRVFFTASAAPNARINISPRGVEAFAVLDDKTAVYLDRTGSGNETAAHLKADGRLTLMFCAFEGPAKILRLYGRGEVLRRGSAAYDELLTSAFAGAEPIGARQTHGWRSSTRNLGDRAIQDVYRDARRAILHIVVTPRTWGVAGCAIWCVECSSWRDVSSRAQGILRAYELTRRKREAPRMACRVLCR